MNTQPETMVSKEIPYIDSEKILSDCMQTYAIALANHTHPEYPEQPQRLFLDRIPYQNGLITLPNDGPWVVGNVYPEQAEKYNEVIHNIGYPKGCDLDADYRPLHPWWKEMVRRADIGGVVGKGFFYHWGANYTADAAVTACDVAGKQHLLLIQRNDTKEWALPGGFLEDYESSKMGAVRELYEEAGLLLDRSNASAEKLYAGPVLDLRTTLHAWVETSLWLFQSTFTTLPQLIGADDAVAAQWFPVDNLPVNLYGSHPVLIQAVLNRTLGTESHLEGEQYHL